MYCTVVQGESASTLCRRGQRQAESQRPGRRSQGERWSLERSDNAKYFHNHKSLSKPQRRCHYFTKQLCPPGAVATFPRFFSRLQLPHTQSPVCCRRVRVWAHQSQTLHWRARATAPPVSGHMTSPGISVEDHREVQWLHSCTACTHAVCLLPTNRDKLKGSGFTAVSRSAVH